MSFSFSSQQARLQSMGNQTVWFWTFSVWMKIQNLNFHVTQSMNNPQSELTVQSSASHNLLLVLIRKSFFFRALISLWIFLFFSPSNLDRYQEKKEQERQEYTIHVWNYEASYWCQHHRERGFENIKCC